MEQSRIANEQGVALLWIQQGRNFCAFLTFFLHLSKHIRYAYDKSWIEPKPAPSAFCFFFFFFLALCGFCFATGQ